MSSKILLIEDAEESKDLVCGALGSSFDVSWALSIKDAQEQVKKNKFDLIILDVGLPDGDGFQFYSLLKANDETKGIPAIFLTARDSIGDKVMGISMGAEDYVIKPFSPLELRARVEMRIKKKLERTEEGKIIKRKGFELNLPEQRAFLISEGDKTDLQLTSLEFKILVLLVTREETIFSRDQLLNQVWGGNTFLTDRCIDTHIYELRKKLGKFATWIQSVYGQGYRFSTKASESSGKIILKKAA